MANLGTKTRSTQLALRRVEFARGLNMHVLAILNLFSRVQECQCWLDPRKGKTHAWGN